MQCQKAKNVINNTSIFCLHLLKLFIVTTMLFLLLSVGVKLFIQVFMFLRPELCITQRLILKLQGLTIQHNTYHQIKYGMEPSPL